MRKETEREREEQSHPLFMYSFSFSEKVIAKKLKFLEFNFLSISPVLERFHFFQFHPTFTSYAIECLLIHAKIIFKRF